MRRFLSFLTMVLVIFVASESEIESRALKEQPAQEAHQRVSVRAQPDAPLSILSVTDHSDDPAGSHVDFTVKNVSHKQVQAFWISYDTVAGGQQVTLGFGVNAQTQDEVLQPSKLRALNISNSSAEKIKLWIDFVEFADGTTWGADTAKYADSLVGQRLGARAESTRLLKLLKTSGVQAVVDDIAKARNANTATSGLQATTEAAAVRDAGIELAGRSAQWILGFHQAVATIHYRIQRAYNKNGLLEVEAELHRPYDISARSY